MLVLLLLGCDSGSASTVTFTVDDDAETFTDARGDGVEVTCNGDGTDVSLRLQRGIFRDEDEGPRFHVWLDLEHPDEGEVYAVDALRLVDVGYHESAFPVEAGTVTVTDWVAVDEVARIAVDLVGLGDLAGVNHLDGTITCEQ
jgi:hypothetical protein